MTLPRLPQLGRSAATLAIVGVGTIVAGVVADLDVHLFSHLDAGSPHAHAAHAIVLLGMVLVLIAVVVDGHSGRHPRTGPHL